MKVCAHLSSLCMGCLFVELAIACICDSLALVKMRSFFSVYFLGHVSYKSCVIDSAMSLRHG